MPPLKGIDRAIDGDLLRALEMSGHGDRIAIVDPSYAIPEGANVFNYHGDSSAEALTGILSLINSEDVLLMRPDVGDGNHNAQEAFLESAEAQGVKTVSYTKGSFYDRVNDPEKRARTLYVRTRDEKACACATFIIGHSQE